MKIVFENKKINEDRAALASRIRKGQLRHGNSLADNQNDADEVKAADAYDPQFGFEWDEDGDTKIQFQDRQMNTNVLRKDNNKFEKQPRVSSHTWGRVWSNGDLEKQFEGPKNIVRQDMARYLDDTRYEEDFDESLSKKRMNEDYDSLLNHFGISRREIGLSVDENGDLVVVADFTASPKKLREYAYVLDALANEYSK